VYSVNPITGEIVEVGPGKRFESMDEAKRAGWPETRAQASDCELVTAATDAARLKMLAAVANSRLDPRAPSRRRSIAASQLEDK
jgi:hypothetical protein